MSQNQRRHDLSVWSSGPLFGGFDTDPRCDLQRQSLSAESSPASVLNFRANISLFKDGEV